MDPANDGLVNLDHTDAIALVDDTGTVIQFLSWNGNTVSPSVGPAAGMTSTLIGTGSFGSSFETTDAGSSYQNQASPNPGTIPCFASGTNILTPCGERGIETLRVGDDVVTAAGEVRQIRWVQSRAVSFIETPKAPRPIIIAAGALGPSCPMCDLVVSTQHRIAVGAFGQLERLFPEPGLLAAKSLTALKGVRVMQGERQIVWHHLALDTHDLLVAVGCVAESLFFGPMCLQSLTRRDALNLRERMPHRLTERGHPDDMPALPIIPTGGASRFIMHSTRSGQAPAIGTTRDVKP